jgi:hypothetical protein
MSLHTPLYLKHQLSILQMVPSGRALPALLSLLEKSSDLPYVPEQLTTSASSFGPVNTATAGSLGSTARSLTHLNHARPASSFFSQSVLVLQPEIPAHLAALRAGKVRKAADGRRKVMLADMTFSLSTLRCLQDFPGWYPFSAQGLLSCHSSAPVASCWAASKAPDCEGSAAQGVSCTPGWIV